MPDWGSIAAAAFSVRVAGCVTQAAMPVSGGKRKSTGSDRGKASKAKVTRAAIPDSAQRCIDQIVGWLLVQIPLHVSKSIFRVRILSFPIPSAESFG